MTVNVLSTAPSGGTAGIPFPHPAASWSQSAGCQSAVESDVVRFVERQLNSWAGHQRTVLVTVPAPFVAPESVLAATAQNGSQPAFGFFWDGGDGVVAAGLGATHRIQLSGPQRFRKLRQEADRIWRRLAVATHDSCHGSRGSSPRLYGGLAFDPAAPVQEPWHELGGGGFTLPRWLYQRTQGYGHSAGQATLSFAVRGEDIGNAPARTACLEELEQTLDTLAVRRPTTPEGLGAVALGETSRSHFLAEVEAIRQAIEAGQVRKVVAARQRRLLLAPSPQGARVASILERLAGLQSSKRFAFCRQHTTFLGATPERLITQRGRRIETEALAGTLASDADAIDLLQSPKDREEHQLVALEIARRLAPLCDELHVDPSPRLRRLRDVVHLRTAIDGTLKRSRHVLDTLERLHPTPAVAGLPTAAALRWIREREIAPRGWYAGPVGWFDAAGDGEFAVALRCCLLRGSEAHLYAGAGIVGGSDPELEYAETELKMKTLLPALCASKGCETL